MKMYDKATGKKVRFSRRDLSIENVLNAKAYLILHEDKDVRACADILIKKHEDFEDLLLKDNDRLIEECNRLKKEPQK